MGLLFIEIILVILVFFFSSGINGNDFWWHVKAGEWIATHGQIPQTDIFSWIGMEKGISWTAHEWLAEVIFYLIHMFAGEIGIYLLTLIFVGMLSLLMYIKVKDALVRNYLLAGLFFACYAITTSIFFYGRPHVFSYFLLFAELHLLYEFYEKKGSKKIWLIPLIACLWSNLHGGSSSLAYLLCFVFLGISCLEISWGRVYASRLQKKELLTLAMVAVTSLGAILVNPVGWKVLTYPYTSLGDALMMKVISEWQAPDAKMIGHVILFFLPIGLMTIGLITEEVKVRMIDIAVMLVFLYLFFRSSRFIILWDIAAVFYACRYIPECNVKKISTKYEEWTMRGCLLLLAGLMCWGGYRIVKTVSEGNIITKVLSEEMVEQVKASEPQRLFNDYNLGEALIYNEIEVFFDARADLFAAEGIFADGLSLTFLECATKSDGGVYADIEGLVDKYQFDSMLLLKVRPIYAYVMSHPERYRLLFEDDSCGYFQVLR